MMEKIAIIGLSCLFPDAQTPEEFWQNLVTQKDSKSLATAAELGINPTFFYNPVKGTPDKSYCLTGSFVKGFHLDTSGYHIPSEFIESLDNIFKWSLYVAKEALQDSGYLENDNVLAKCGVILGNYSFSSTSSQQLVTPIYQQTVELAVKKLLQSENFNLPNSYLPKNISPCNALISGYPAAVVAQALSLSGPSFCLDAACASSLYAIGLACKYLALRKADLMLAGGVNCSDPLLLNLGFSQLQAYPGNGISRPLDQVSQGIVTGQGAGMVALKRYSDALKDADKIYGTICGVALSNDGRGKHLLTPNPKGQLHVFQQAYANSRIDPKSIDYVECHATGTPLGDITELNSMEVFFGQHGAEPLIGSVKSNLGHLLTAAGIASVIKVILSMCKGLIPATIHLENPLHSQNNIIKAKQIVNTNTSWPSQDSFKRAAVSAFGFGGTNAHLILEQGNEVKLPLSSEVESNIPVQSSKIAIIGMDAFFGSSHGLDAFESSIYDGDQHFIPVPSQRWKGIDNHQHLLREYGFEDGKPPLGAYCKDFEIDSLYFKIPPSEVDALNPQQLLVLKIADNALRDAGFTRDDSKVKNVAVIIAMGAELSVHQLRARVDLSWQIKESLTRRDIFLPPEKAAELEAIAKDSIHLLAASSSKFLSYVGNIMASRISALWNFSGPSFTLSAEENSAIKALEVAQMLLTTKEVDAVILGSVDLAGSFEHVLLRNQLAKVNTGESTLSYDCKVNGWMVGEGVGALVLKLYEAAKQNNDRIYAVIDAISLKQNKINSAESSSFPYLPSAEIVAQACEEAFTKAKINPAMIGYLEVMGSGIRQEDEAEIKGLSIAYHASQSTLNCAIGSVKANFGHTYAASGIASLIKTALCLYHRYIPATPNWSGTKYSEAWQGTPFYVPLKSRPWLLKEATVKRVAAINSLGLDGACAHLILSEEPSKRDSQNRYLEHRPFYLFPIAADDIPTLLDQLSDLQQSIQCSSSLITATRQNFVTFQRNSQATYAVSIVGHNKDELLQEIQRAIKGISNAFDKGKEWKTPLGSYFTAKPLGKQGNIAFVYPGAFNSYPGLGQDIFRLFPNSYERLASFTSNLCQMVSEELIYPKSLDKLSTRQLENLETKLNDDSIAMLESGTSFAVLFTSVMKDYFKVQPRFTFGYSLGETSMMYALGVWRNCDLVSSILRSSPLFRSRLSGPKDTVRKHWRLPKKQDDKDEILWDTYVLIAPPSTVKECLKNETRVYLTHINTPKEVVIAGEPQRCLQVIKTLNCDFFRTPSNHVLHCEAMSSEYNEFVKLNTLPVHLVPEINFYSSANYEPITIDSVSIAQNLAKAVCNQLNFPRLVNQVYEDGARIFIELGSGSTCSRWIGNILKQQEHIAMPINQRGVDDHTSIVRVLAKLISHRASVDLSPLYSAVQECSGSNKYFVKTITLGGNQIESNILSEQNRKNFQGLALKDQLYSTSKFNQPLQDISQIQTRESQGKQYGEHYLSEVDICIQEPANGQQNCPKTVPCSTVIQKHMSEPGIPYLQNFQFSGQDQRTSSLRVAHMSFLQMRWKSLQNFKEMVQLQINLLQKLPSHTHQVQVCLPHSNLYQPLLSTYNKTSGVVWDEVDLLEFATGKVSSVFGKEYEIIDSYPRRVRLPSPPYLLISRVTQIDAKRGCYQPCFIQTEYDIPSGTWYTVNGQVPAAVAIESGQGDLLLISYLGIDFQNQGNRVYRLLDGSFTFLDELPKEGDTLRYDIKINSFARSGDTLLFFFSYKCFVNDKIILKLDRACAGFFSNEDLEKGRGIVVSNSEIDKRRKIHKQHFEPLLSCQKTFFSEEDILQLSKGKITACFGNNYEQGYRNPSLCLPPKPLLMIDRVVLRAPQGGHWGLGLVIAEKILDAEDWYFICHFKDDQVMAGSLVAEGCFQLLQFYLLSLGLQLHTVDARFQPVTNRPHIVRCRGQITPKATKLTYRLEIVEISLHPRPYAIGNVDVILDTKKVVVSFQNLGVQLLEKKIL